MVDAIPALVTEESVRMFEKIWCLHEGRAELQSGDSVRGLCKSHQHRSKSDDRYRQQAHHPCSDALCEESGRDSNEIREAGADDSVPVEILKRLTALLSEARKALLVLKDVTRTANSLEAGEKQAHYYHDEVCTAMAALRLPVDELEMIVDKEEWPMPSYGDLLFEV